VVVKRSLSAAHPQKVPRSSKTASSRQIAYRLSAAPLGCLLAFFKITTWWFALLPNCRQFFTLRGTIYVGQKQSYAVVEIYRIPARPSHEYPAHAAQIRQLWCSYKAGDVGISKSIHTRPQTEQATRSGVCQSLPPTKYTWWFAKIRHPELTHAAAISHVLLRPLAYFREAHIRLSTQHQFLDNLKASLSLLVSEYSNNMRGTGDGDIASQGITKAKRSMKKCEACRTRKIAVSIFVWLVTFE
jgi:hypothetical protein